MEYKGERAQSRLDELLSEIDDWATEAFWTGFYSGCEHERELIDEINWLNAELHGAELKARKARKAERTCQEVEVTARYQPYVTYMTACSLCGGTLAVEEYSAPNYCPNCGARVVE